MEAVFFRIVRTDPPGERDFESYAVLGIPLIEDSADALDLAAGVSMYATEAQARRKAKARSFRDYAFIAQVEIDDEISIRWRRTKGPGHYTVWGEAATLLKAVVRISPI